MLATYSHRFYFIVAFSLLLLCSACPNLEQTKPTSDIWYETTAHFPLTKRTIIRQKLKTQGHIRNLDTQTGKLVDYEALWAEELETYQSRYGKQTPQLNEALTSSQDLFRVRVHFHCDKPDVTAWVQQSREPGKLLVPGEAQIMQWQEERQSLLDNCRNLLGSQLSEQFSIPSENIEFAPASPHATFSIGRGDLAQLETLPLIISIDNENDWLSKNIYSPPGYTICYGHQPDDYYGEIHEMLGEMRLTHQLMGKGVKVAQVELAAADLSNPCFNYGAPNLYNKNLPPQIKDANNPMDPVVHANLVAARMVSRKSPNSNCPPANCVLNSQTDPFLFYGAAKDIELLSVNGMQKHFLGYKIDEKGYDWAYKNGANVFSVSAISYFGAGKHIPFNAFDSRPDDFATEVLPIMGSGNDPTQQVANAAMNALIVGAYEGGLINGQQRWRFPISTINPDSSFSPNGDLHKPDVVAFNALESTSLATPKVSALAAMLLELMPGLKYKPEALKAVIMATACRVFGDTCTGCLDRSKYGAGGVNGEHAVRIIKDYLDFAKAKGASDHHPNLGFRYVFLASEFEPVANQAGRFRYTWPGGQPEFEVKPEYTVRAALTWVHQYTDRRHPTDGLTDFDLLIQRFDPTSNTWVDESFAGTFDNNAEILRHEVSLGNEGKYRLEILLGNIPANKFIDRVAWSVFVHPKGTIECN